MSEVRVERAETLEGSLRVPGDKSTSHRALMISALADGESTIIGLSGGMDVAATAQIMEQLGATHHVEGHVTTVIGPSDGLRASADALDCGNSGTTMRLLTGIAAGVAGTHRLVGDASLSARPMDRVALPLGLMGASIEGQGDRCVAPLQIEGSRALHGISFEVPMASAQVKSAILFAALGASGPTTVGERVRTRPTTEMMLSRAGVGVVSMDDRDGRHVTLHPGRPLPRAWTVPGDPSQAAFFAVLGCIHPRASLDVVDIDNAPERIGYLDVLQRMGATLSVRSTADVLSFSVRSSELLATEVHAKEIPSVAEVPVLVVAAAAAAGVSAFRDMGELRLKESDRFTGSMSLAAKLGCHVWSEGDDIFVEGLGDAGRFADFALDATLDHRMVMASAVAGCAGGGASILSADTVASSYPNFFRDLASLE